MRPSTLRWAWPPPQPAHASSSGAFRLSLGLDREAWQTAVEPAGEGPGPAAQELEHRGHQDAADDKCVEEYRGGHRDAEEHEHAVATQGEGGEDGNHHRRGGG